MRATRVQQRAVPSAPPTLAVWPPSIAVVGEPPGHGRRAYKLRVFPFRHYILFRHTALRSGPFDWPGGGRAWAMSLSTVGGTTMSLSTVCGTTGAQAVELPRRAEPMVKGSPGGLGDLSGLVCFLSAVSGVRRELGVGDVAPCVWSKHLVMWGPGVGEMSGRASGQASGHAEKA